MSEQTLVFNDIEVNNKDFYASKTAIPLNLVNVNNIIISDKIKNNNDTSKYFIGCLHDDDVIKSLCIVLPQMSGYIKYFENGGKHMSFKIKVEDMFMMKIYLKYNEIWNTIESMLNVKFHSQPIYHDKYIKTKVKTFSNMINTPFSGDEIPKERNHYLCIAAICIDSMLRVGRKNYPQVYLEQCKYKTKKRELTNFIDDEINLSTDESDLDD